MGWGLRMGVGEIILAVFLLWVGGVFLTLFGGRVVSGFVVVVVVVVVVGHNELGLFGSNLGLLLGVFGTRPLVRSVV